MLTWCAVPVASVSQAVLGLQERPEDLQSKLEGLLKDNEIAFSYSKATKFHNFVNKTLE